MSDGHVPDPVPPSRRVTVPLALEDYARLVALAGSKAGVPPYVARLVRQHLEHSEHTRAALARLKSAGRRLGQRPLEGEALRRAQELRHAGMTLERIAQALTNEGFETKRGGRWAHQTVRLLLQRSAGAEEE